MVSNFFDRSPAYDGKRKPLIYPPVWFLIAEACTYGLSQLAPSLGLATEQLLQSSTLHVFKPVLTFLSPPCNHWRWGLCAIVGTAGLALTASSSSLFRRQGTEVKPFEKVTKLVTEGAYQYTRNPMYSSFLYCLSSPSLTRNV
jgi:protein-S-isoprenylcysteine O-methyltransferase Ste14